MKKIIIGSNSILIKMVLDRYPELSENEDNLFLSHVDLDETENLSCDEVLIFSYSKNYEDNLHLAYKVKKIRSSCVTYISSFSVYAFGGWLPRYPKVKAYSELVFQLICDASVVRLGVFDEIHSFEKIGLAVPVTTLEDLRILISSPSGNIPVNYYKFRKIGESGWLMKSYALIYYLFGGNLFLLRGIDLLYKVLGHTVYGYTYKSILNANYG